MAIPNQLLNSGYYGPDQERYMERLLHEQMRQMQIATHYNSLSGVQNSLGQQQAQPIQPITNPEPNPVLLLLE